MKYTYKMNTRKTRYIWLLNYSNKNITHYTNLVRIVNELERESSMPVAVRSDQLIAPITTASAS